MRPAPPAHLAGYPVREISLSLPSLSLHLLTVDRLEDLVDSAALLRDGDVAEPPYWAHAWTGSRVLAELLVREIDCRDRRVIDLGCGLGMAGVAAAKLGGRAILADYVFPALVFARANAERNNCRVDLAQIDLRQSGLRGPFDLCLAADITYDPALQLALAELARDHLTPNGEVWCAESVRTTDRGLSLQCERLGLEVEERQVAVVDEGRNAVVRVTRVRRPSQ